MLGAFIGYYYCYFFIHTFMPSFLGSFSWIDMDFFLGMSLATIFSLVGMGTLVEWCFVLIRMSWFWSDIGFTFRAHIYCHGDMQLSAGIDEHRSEK